MLRPGLFALLSVQLLALVACHNEQVNPGASAGYTVGIGVTTAQPTSPSPSTSSAASSGSDGAEASSAGTSGGASNGGTSSTGDTGTSSSSTGDPELASTSEGTTSEPPLLLDCFGCLCDVNTTFCRQVIWPVQGAVAYEPGGPCPIVDVEEKESGCVLYPESCDPPSCECIPTMDGHCQCSLLEDGTFQVICILTLP